MLTNSMTKIWFVQYKKKESEMWEDNKVIIFLLWLGGKRGGEWENDCRKKERGAY